MTDCLFLSLYSIKTNAFAMRGARSSAVPPDSGRVAPQPAYHAGRLTRTGGDRGSYRDDSLPGVLGKGKNATLSVAQQDHSIKQTTDSFPAPLPLPSSPFPSGDIGHCRLSFRPGHRAGLRRAVAADGLLGVNVA